MPSKLAFDCETWQGREVAVSEGELERSASYDPRGERNALLAASDWTQMPDAPLSEKKRAEWTAYRQKLRDLPEKKNQVLPEPPS